MILAIDPGTTQSAFVHLDEKTLKPLMFGKWENEGLRHAVKRWLVDFPQTHYVCEMVASYGMSVGQTTFETCFWIGRFWEAAEPALSRTRLFRKSDICMNLCHSTRAKDTNIRQALIDRFGPVGTKRAPGWFYGVTADVWSAIAVGVTLSDLRSGK